MGNRLPPLFRDISFHAQHSPIGAFASFTCGQFGSRGGFGLEIGKPGNQNIYIGIKSGDRSSNGPVKVLPFFEGASSNEAGRYDVERAAGPAEAHTTPKFPTYQPSEIRRHYGWATDAWKTDDFEFAIYTPFLQIPDLHRTSVGEWDRALIPAIYATLTVDNTRGTTSKTAFFAMQFAEAGVRMIPTIDDSSSGSSLGSTDDSIRCGFAFRRKFGISARCIDSQRNHDLDPRHEPSAHPIDGRPFGFNRFDLESGIKDPVPHQLGSVPGIGITVPPGQSRTLAIGIGFFFEGIATTGLEGDYFYSRAYRSLEHVLDSALSNIQHAIDAAHHLDEKLLRSTLSADQQFLIAHATRSYHGSTQLLDVGGEPYWIVNEGEYCMLNTLDLSVDQVFWELDQHPWVVKNLLDNFVRHYSYVDQIKVPKASAIQLMGKQAVDSPDVMNTPRTLGTTIGIEHYDIRPGGISFCHDQGIHNNFSPQGRSSYELPDLVGCFSHMSGEELCNWILIAAVYVARTGDLEWARANEHIIEACRTSLRNRADDSGIIVYDSLRCQSGSEITTYDSLDHSLAQTRSNLYMAVKAWASLRGLLHLRQSLGHADASDASKSIIDQAQRAARTVVKHANPDGVIPAVFEAENPGHASRILPAVEGLLYPQFWNEDVRNTAPELVKILKHHTLALLKDPQQRNLFPDGGLRLSSTSANSWMSKIAIFQHVCRSVLGLEADPEIKSIFDRADAAHVGWMLHPISAYWACSDQFVDGIARGSKYYPRIISSALWMREHAVHLQPTTCN